MMEEKSEEEYCIPVDMSQICRFCASNSEKLIGFYSEEGILNDIVNKINSHLPVKVSEVDELPLQCCIGCISTILAWNELFLRCLETDRRLRSFQEITIAKKLMNSGVEAATEQDNNDHSERIESAAVSASTTENLAAFCRIDDKNCTVIDKHKFVDGHQSILHSALTSDNCVDTPFFNNLKRTNDTDKIPVEEEILIDHRMAEEMEDDPLIAKGYLTCRSTMFLMDLPDDDNKDASPPLITSTEADKRGKKEKRKNNKIDQDVTNAAKVIVDGRIYYNCKECGKSLHSPYTYIWHMRIHTGERPFVCDLCGKQFRVSQGLVRHLRETHQGIKKFPCDLCGRMFATRRNVEEHRRIHTNERPYICDLCGKSFKQKASLFVHKRSHKNYFPFKCSYCNQGFRTKPPLMVHITRHTGEKPYKCEICGRCFRIKYELKRHRLIHSDEKPFSCNICGLSFRQKRYLRNHMKSNHALVGLQ